MLKAQITKDVFDNLSADVQAHYQQDGDNYNIDLEDNSPLKRTVQTLRSDLQKKEKELKDLKYEIGDLDITAAKSAIEKMEEFANLDPEKKLEEQKKLLDAQYLQKFETDKKTLVDKYNKDLSERDTSIAELGSSLEREIIENRASAEFIKQGGRRDDIDLFNDRIRKQMKRVRLDNGQHTLSIIDLDGTDRLSTKAGSTDPMSLTELVTEVKGKHPSIFDGSGASGSGGGRTDSNTEAGVTYIPNTNQDKAQNLEGIADGTVKVQQ